MTSKILRLTALWAIFGSVAALPGQATWWSQTLAPMSGPVIPGGSTADDFAPATLGQLKNMAYAAYLHFDAEGFIDGTAEATALTNHISAFVNIGTGAPIVTGSTNDFAPANIGQLKFIVMPFYDLMLSATNDLNTTQMLVLNGGQAGWTEPLPWTASTSDDNDFAPVNLGQIKWAFSFDVTGLNNPVDPPDDTPSDVPDITPPDVPDIEVPPPPST